MESAVEKKRDRIGAIWRIGGGEETWFAVDGGTLDIVTIEGLSRGSRLGRLSIFGSLLTT